MFVQFNFNYIPPIDSKTHLTSSRQTLLISINWFWGNIESLLIYKRKQCPSRKGLLFNKQKPQTDPDSYWPTLPALVGRQSHWHPMFIFCKHYEMPAPYKPFNK